jgi:hypothetical protein
MGFVTSCDSLSSDSQQTRSGLHERMIPMPGRQTLSDACPAEALAEAMCVANGRRAVLITRGKR